MKRIIGFAAFALLCVGNMFAQDRVITKEGDVFDAFRLDIGGNYIYYTNEDKDDAAVQKIAKSEVLMIKKKDGTKITVSEFTPTTQSSQPAQTSNSGHAGIIQVKLEDLSLEAKADNDALLFKYNAPVEIVVEEKMKKHIGKGAPFSILGIYGIKANSILSNDDLQIKLIQGSLKNEKNKNSSKWSEDYYAANSAVAVSIRNKTDKTLYVNLENTLFSILGQTTCFYEAYSANTSTQDYSQKVIAIPSYSSISLPPIFLFGNEEKVLTKGFYLKKKSVLGGLVPYINFSKNSDSKQIKFGESCQYSEDASPLQMSCAISYSDTKDCAVLKTMTSYFYLREIICNTCFSGMFGAYIDVDATGRLLNMFLVSTKKDTEIGEFPIN
ncbi:MAG: hypothetical protein ACI4AH_00790 [Muribaculaceae bacterium]